MKAKYIQPGNTIDYKNTGSSDITYGSIVPLGTTRVGVAAAAASDLQAAVKIG